MVVALLLLLFFSYSYTSFFFLIFDFNDEQVGLMGDGLQLFRQQWLP